LRLHEEQLFAFQPGYFGPLNRARSEDVFHADVEHTSFETFDLAGEVVVIRHDDYVAAISGEQRGRQKKCVTKGKEWSGQNRFCLHDVSPRRLDLRRQVKIVPGIEKVVSQIIECDAVELIGAGTEKGAWEFDGLESQRA